MRFFEQVRRKKKSWPAPSLCGTTRELVVAVGTTVAVVERLVQQAFDSGALQFRRSDGTLVDSTRYWHAIDCMHVEPVSLPVLSV